MRCAVGDARCAPPRVRDAQACSARCLCAGSMIRKKPAPGEERQRLPRGVRLVHSQAHGGWVLLAPERVFKADAIAVEIIKRCTGEATWADIIDDLVKTYAAPREKILAD